MTSDKYFDKASEIFLRRNSSTCKKPSRFLTNFPLQYCSWLISLRSLSRNLYGSLHSANSARNKLDNAYPMQSINKRVNQFSNLHIKKKAQVSIYIIVAIVLVLAIVIFFVARSQIGQDNVPSELSPVFDYYQDCITQETRTAVELAGMQGGHVFITDYVPGSEYAPFSSQLNFLGSPVPYWYYISGNGVIKEQVPTVQDMQNEIAEYVKQGLKQCDFEYFRRQGFSVTAGEPEIDVAISTERVEVDALTDLNVQKGAETARKTEYNIEIDSKLGKFYNTAKEIYNEEKSNAFLENYAIDVLYNYAPVDGVEIQCSPKIWLTRKIMDSFKVGLEENIATIKFNGNYYDLKDDVRKYFVVDKDVDEAVNLMYSQNWPTKIEIYGEGVDDEIMISQPIGTQAGLGAMGFCYIPYHFVYDASFPVMVQIFNTEEIFQFPIVVVIDNNKPRQAILPDTPVEEPEFDFCQYRTQEITLNLYDVNLNRVDANVSYECFDQQCRLGETENGQITTFAPACVNGYLNVRAEGYAEKKQLFSSNSERFADVILEREHEVKIELEVGGTKSDETAVVSFTRDDGKSSSVALPEGDSVKLSEGSYEVRVYVYGNSSITIPASTKTQCVDVPREGLLGLFGSTKENCFDISVPETKIESALIGGGKLNTYLLESELEKGALTLGVDRLPRPNSIEDLGKNFELFENKFVRMEFS